MGERNDGRPLGVLALGEVGEHDGGWEAWGKRIGLSYHDKIEVVKKKICKMQIVIVDESRLFQILPPLAPFNCQWGFLQLE